MDKDTVYVRHIGIERPVRRVFELIGVRETLLSIADQIIHQAYEVVPGCSAGVEITLPEHKPFGKAVLMEWNKDTPE